MSGEGQGGVWARQRRRRGGQDQTFPVAGATTADREKERFVLVMQQHCNDRVEFTAAAAARRRCSVRAKLRLGLQEKQTRARARLTVGAQQR